MDMQSHLLVCLKPVEKPQTGFKHVCTVTGLRFPEAQHGERNQKAIQRNHNVDKPECRANQASLSSMFRTSMGYSWQAQCWAVSSNLTSQLSSCPGAMSSGLRTLPRDPLLKEMIMRSRKYFSHQFQRQKKARPSVAHSLEYQMLTE